MANNKMPGFIVIDDDPVNNKICSIIIQRLYPEIEILSFTDPEVALTHIEHVHQGENAHNTILLLDINMPVLSGWDVLEHFKHLPQKIQSHFRIYILSSSVDVYDKRRAGDNEFVRGYIEKPLTLQRVEELFAEANK